MELRQLRYFVTLAEIGSVSRAAVLLGVAQPAISRQIRLLEDEFGVALFYRTGRGMELTEAGHLLAARASTILTDLRQLENDVRDLRGVADGQVTLGVPPTESYFLVTPLVQRLRRSHPGISLKVLEAFSGHVNEWLSAGRIDVALFYRAPRTTHLEADELVTERLYFVGARGSLGDGPALGLADVVDRDFILPSRAHGLRLLVDGVAQAKGLTLTVPLEIDALLTLKGLTEAGVGITILPHHAVARDVEEGKLDVRPVADVELSRTLLLATSTQHPLSLSSRVVVREIQALVRDLVASRCWVGAMAS